MPEPAATPAAQGYRMPAEWEPHHATWLTWPRPGGISFPDRYDAAPPFWVRMCELLHPHERVDINVFDRALEDIARGHLARAGLEKALGKSIHFHPFPAYEPWCRDHGPIFVTRPDPPRLAVIDWGYNAWGGKYPPFDLDDAIPQRVAAHLGLPLFQPGLVMEGGSIDVNGRGCLLTTTSCLLHPNRNPGKSQAEIEAALRDHLGVSKVLWLGDGIEGDDTDGHVDDIARFVAHDTLVTCVEDDPSDPNFGPLMANYERLLRMTDVEGRPFRVVSLPMPERLEHEGQRLPASYANFYIANRNVLVPVFGCAADSEALVTLRELFPGRQVHGIDCRDLVWGLGAFHCVTQQQPSLD